MTKYRFYILLTAGITLAWCWLLLQLLMPALASFTPCLFKNITSYPCPACGTTRSVLSLLDGHVATAIAVNPLGLFAMLMLLAIPACAFTDILYKRQKLYDFYMAFDSALNKRPSRLVLIIALIAANWIWNIYKGL